MALMKFKNLPDTSTPINATNLNNNFDSVNPVGSILITSTNTNPSSELGGTWELIDKEFTSYSITDSGNGDIFQKNTTNVGDYNIYFTRSGHSIMIRLMCKNLVELNDDAVELGNILFEKLGISRTYYSLYSHLGGTDGGNAVVQCTLNYTSGLVTVTDVLHKVVGSNVATDSEIYFEFNLTLHRSHMLDDACNKFYWKRTA